MLNRLLLVIGMVCGVTVMPLLFYVVVADLYTVIFLTQDELAISRVYALAPLLGFIALMCVVTAPLLVFKRLHYAVSFREKYVNRNIFISLSLLTVALLFILKPLLDTYLVANGYEYEKTVHVEKSFDVDIYVHSNIQNLPN